MNRTLSFLAIPFVAGALLLGACGGSSSADSASADSPSTGAAETVIASDAPATAEATPTTEATPTAGAPAADANGAAQQLPAEFTECLKEQGVELPSAGAAPQGAPDPKLQEAFGKCRDKLPAGALPGLGNGAGAGAGGPDLTALITCLNDNGLEIASGAGFEAIDRNDPDFAKASEACRPLFPGLPSTPGATSVPPATTTAA